MALIASPNMSPEQYAALKTSLGLDKSWGEQLWIYMKNFPTATLVNPWLEIKQ